MTWRIMTMSTYCQVLLEAANGVVIKQQMHYALLVGQARLHFSSQSLAIQNGLKSYNSYHRHGTLHHLMYLFLLYKFSNCVLHYYSRIFKQFLVIRSTESMSLNFKSVACHMRILLSNFPIRMWIHITLIKSYRHAFQQTHTSRIS